MKLAGTDRGTAASPRHRLPRRVFGRKVGGHLLTAERLKTEKNRDELREERDRPDWSKRAPTGK
jgi:hypothetical protein